MQIRRYRIASNLIFSAVILSSLNSWVSADQKLITAIEKTGDSTAVASPQIEPPKASIFTQTGIASWYGGSFVNRRTASGERYRPEERTAAHRTLAFGTYVRVINLRNKKSAIVRINNRGPYIKGRIIDLSRQAATDIGLVKTGLTRVHVEVLAKEVAVAELAALETSS